MGEDKEKRRYPGPESFQDNSHHRKLFKGRDIESRNLLHLVLAESLVVLHGKSGIGKTSLLNAGIMKQLRKRGYLPFMLRFNYPARTPLQCIYHGIRDFIQKSKEYFVCEGDKWKDDEDSENVKKLPTLWEYFKSVEFWRNDRCLIPVLILDQFEELFIYHQSRDQRKDFFKQLADIVRGRMPEDLFKKEQLSLDRTPPEVKIIISIREDRLGRLEELSTEIPAILHNRFVIEPLQREAAEAAIGEPAKFDLEDSNFTNPFSYNEKALKE